MTRVLSIFLLLAAALPAQVPAGPRADADAAYRAWRQTDAGLEIDLRTRSREEMLGRIQRIAEAAQRAAVAERTAAESASAMDGAIAAFLVREIAAGVPGRAEAWKAQDNIVAAEIKSLTRSIGTFARDTDPGIREVRQAMIKERAALNELKAALAVEEQLSAARTETSSRAEAARAEAMTLFAGLAGLSAADGVWIDNHGQEWQNYYRRLQPLAAGRGAATPMSTASQPGVTRITAQPGNPRVEAMTAPPPRAPEQPSATPAPAKPSEPSKIPAAVEAAPPSATPKPAAAEPAAAKPSPEPKPPETRPSEPKPSDAKTAEPKPSPAAAPAVTAASPAPASSSTPPPQPAPETPKTPPVSAPAPASASSTPPPASSTPPPQPAPEAPKTPPVSVPPPASAPSVPAAPAPLVDLSRYRGEWMYPLAAGRYEGVEPATAVMAVKTEGNRITGTLSVRFQVPAGARRDSRLDIDFSGTAVEGASQKLEAVRDGVRGEFELSPGDAINLIDVRWQLPDAAVRGNPALRQGKLVLVKK